MREGVVTLLVILYVTALSGGEYWPGRYCCSLPFNTQCRNACQRARSKEGLSEQCKPHHEVAFFNCVERQEMSAHCCGPATSSQCQAVCKAIFLEASLPSRSQREAVTEYCDSHVATCIRNFTKGTPANDPTESLPCCDHTNNVQCQTTCRETLRTLTVEEEIIDEIVKACGQPNLAVSLKCAALADPQKVKKLKGPVPQSLLLGQEKSNGKMELWEAIKTQEFASRCSGQLHPLARPASNHIQLSICLQSGNIYLTLDKDPLWQCFLRKSSDVRPQDNSGGTIETAGIDGAKLLCCTKSKTSTCRNLCVKTYSRGWTNSWNRFHRECAYHPMEADLNLCLQEVDEPCQMGCEGLQYCSNYNSRATELFRSCSAQADRAARGDVLLWARGTIRLPLMDDIPVKDISQCQPDMWKAIACTLQIKPCHRQAHTTIICRADCIRILSQCVDWSQLPASQTAEGLCNILSPVSDVTYCIPLHHYLTPSLVSVRASDISQPCSPNPCGSNEVCYINMRKCKHEENCKLHICKPACPVGEVSSMMVARNSYVRIPEAESEMTCYKTCKCGHHNSLTRCTRTGCVRADSCLMGSGRIQAHNSHFMLGCSQCSCYAGELVCQERHCLNSVAPLHDRRRYTGLPCNCANSYLPVCALNSGRTYPSACIARCLGLNDNQFEIGACSNQRPCDSNPCGQNEVCTARRQVCLGNGIKCPQFECVSTEDECSHHRHDPVCDKRQEEFSNICLLLHHKKAMAYWGHCMSGCSNSEVVCGQDGETYGSECAAWASGVFMDYYGHCRTVGHLTANGVDPVCADVTCPQRDVKNCHMITPPGTCCPLCAGEIRLLYSDKLADDVASTGIIPPVTVANITSLLSQQLAVAHCGLFAYLSIEKDIVAIVAPLLHTPSLALVRACLTEAERLGSLLKLSSPIVMSHLVMSPFVNAHTRTAYFTTSAATLWRSTSLVSVLTLIVLLHIIRGRCR